MECPITLGLDRDKAWGMVLVRRRVPWRLTALESDWKGVKNLSCASFWNLQGTPAVLHAIPLSVQWNSTEGGGREGGGSVGNPQLYNTVSDRQSLRPSDSLLAWLMGQSRGGKLSDWQNRGRKRSHCNGRSEFSSLPGAPLDFCRLLLFLPEHSQAVVDLFRKIIQTSTRL